MISMSAAGSATPRISTVERPTITLIIPTIGRPTLAHTLRSVRGQAWIAGDEVLLVGDGPTPAARSLWRQFCLPGRYLEVPGPARDWGHTPRNLVMPQAAAAYLMALDDDDELTPGAVAAVRAALAAAPGRPHLFRMDARSLPEVCAILWRDREVRHGNVGTPMLVLPSAGRRWGTYTPRYGGDCDFIRTTLALWPPASVVWREEIICTVRPDRGRAPTLPPAPAAG